MEKLEKILRFCIKEHCLSVEDLDAIWACQVSEFYTLIEYAVNFAYQIAS